MPLTPDTKLGPYRAIAKIGEGEGGLGEVYRARDTKLGREVALRILQEAFASDPDRLARFQREAQVLASVNHPNIAQIQGLGRAAGIKALVLELVEGPTLADRIAQGPPRSKRHCPSRNRSPRPSRWHMKPVSSTAI